jgi:hypothetical protein
MAKTIVAYYLGRKRDNPKTEWLDRLICFVTRSRYSHLEICYDYSPISGYGYCLSSSPRDRGVRGRLINLQSGHWELYEVATNKTEEDIIEWFGPHLGKKYDWRGAISSWIPLFGENSKRWFCSEIVGAALGVPKSSCKTPQELFEWFEREGHKKI